MNANDSSRLQLPEDAIVLGTASEETKGGIPVVNEPFGLAAGVGLTE